MFFVSLFVHVLTNFTMIPFHLMSYATLATIEGKFQNNVTTMYVKSAIFKSSKTLAEISKCSKGLILVQEKEKIVRFLEGKKEKHLKIIESSLVKLSFMIF